MRDKLIEITDHTHRIRPGIDWISEDDKATWIQTDSRFEKVPVGSLKTGTVVACLAAHHPNVQNVTNATNVPSWVGAPIQALEAARTFRSSSATPNESNTVKQSFLNVHLCGRCKREFAGIDCPFCKDRVVKFIKEYYTGEERVWLIERNSPTTMIRYNQDGSAQNLQWTDACEVSANRIWTALSEADAINLRSSYEFSHPYIEKQSQPEQVLMAGGKAASSKGPAFHLIPTIALTEIANRFEKGIERKKDKAWNATSNNQECLLDKDFAIERLSHVIHHAMKLRDQLVSGVKPRDESMVDNASAVAWGGVFAICAVSAMDGRTPKITQSE